MQIDHDPKEWHYDRSPKYGWLVFLVIGGLWGLNLYSGRPIVFVDVSMGFATGAVLAGYVLNATGNRTPEWMKSPDSRRDGTGK